MHSENYKPIDISSDEMNAKPYSTFFRISLPIGGPIAVLIASLYSNGLSALTDGGIMGIFILGWLYGGLPTFITCLAVRECKLKRDIKGFIVFPILATLTTFFMLICIAVFYTNGKIPITVITNHLIAPLGASFFLFWFLPQKED